MENLEDLLDNEQTAAFLGIKPNTLEIWRCRGRGPGFVKLGDTPQAPVRYRLSVLTAWLERQSFACTSAYSAAASPTTISHICRSAGASA